MWRKVGLGVIAFLLLALGLAWLELARLDHDVRVSIEQAGTAATGTQVRVAGVHVSLTRGLCVISGLVVANPPGFTTPYALSLGTITIQADRPVLVRALLAGAGLPGASLLGSGPLVLDRVDIDRPHIYVEISAGAGPQLSPQSLNPGSSSNLGALQRGAARITLQGGGTRQREIIRRLAVSGGRVSIAASMLKGRVLTERLSVIHLTGIGEAGGATTGQVAHRVLTAITDAAELEAAASLVKAIGHAATGPIDDVLLNRLKSLF